MQKALKIRDLTLREGQQLILSSRIRREDIERLLPLYRNAGFRAVEILGSTLPESMMRLLGESFWERIRLCSEALKGESSVSAVVRARTLFGEHPLPEFVLDNFYKEAFDAGLESVRIWDPLDDSAYLCELVRMMRRIGLEADALLCLSSDPLPEPLPAPVRKSFWKRLLTPPEAAPVAPPPVFTDDFFLNAALDLQRAGCEVITLGAFPGAASPSRVFTLMPKFKITLKSEVGFHASGPDGHGLASALTAIIKGVDILDTNIWWFAGGTAAPPLELIWLFCRKLDIPVDVNMEVVDEIRNALKGIRASLRNYDLQKNAWPKDFASALAEMPKEIDAEFDRAIFAAGENDTANLLEACSKIERYFGFIGSDYGEERSEEEALPEKLIAKVRRDAGMPPLIGSVGKIIMEQAAALASDRSNGAGDYTTVVEVYRNLVQGELGKTPGPVDPAFREKITGSPEEMPYDLSGFKEPENAELPDREGVHLASDDTEFLLLELFPETAPDFLRKKRQSDSRNQAGKPKSLGLN